MKFFRTLLLLILVPLVSLAQEKSRRDVDTSGRKLVTPGTQRAIDKGLHWLAGEQSTEGSFGSTGGYSENVGVTALCGLAFVASGSTPGRGRYGQQVSLATDYLILRMQPNGYILSPKSSQSNGPMYGHGFSTLFLCEVYGMIDRDGLRPKLSKAVQLIVNSQNDEGGWRYSPRSRDADLSVTVCMMMALRAAKNAGFAVPRETVDKCAIYLRKCQNADGGFRYQLESERVSAFARSAAAVVGLNTAGIYSGDEIKSALAYLDGFRPRENFRTKQYYYYGHYYASQAMWQAGGSHWFTWYPAVRDELVASQQSDGPWRDVGPRIGSTYATAMALLVLQTPNNLLPIFQR